MTKRVLAAELGTVSETLSRTLARFRDHGLIEVSGRRLTVRSPARLAAWLEAGAAKG
jgi:CRP/FNR family transcriptional regulator